MNIRAMFWHSNLPFDWSELMNMTFMLRLNSINDACHERIWFVVVEERRIDIKLFLILDQKKIFCTIQIRGQRAQKSSFSMFSLMWPRAWTWHCNGRSWIIWSRSCIVAHMGPRLVSTIPNAPPIKKTAERPTSPIFHRVQPWVSAPSNQAYML